MQGVFRIVTVTALLGLLGACGAGFGGGASPPASSLGGVATDAAAPLTTAVIQTQTLAPLAANALEAGPTTGRIIRAAPATAAPATAAPAPLPAATPSVAPPAQTAAEIGAAAAAALQQGSLATTPEPIALPAPAPTSPEEAACIDEGGRWGRAGSTSAMACFRTSPDAGQTCSKQSDCTSQCLARSRSCAPFWPIFGCTEVIQNDGAVVRLCLE